MTLSFKVSGLNSSKNLVQHKNQSYFLSYPCENASSSSCVPYESTFPAGEYYVQCYGASGGNSAYASGGKGGFSQGVLSLKQRTKVFIFIGGKGSQSNTNYQNSPGGFNGGGIGGFDLYGGYFSGGGGGATDIRINSNNFHNRVIVAGGGGGAAYGDRSCFGGDGGGFQGGGSNDNYYGKGATGATQENGGIAYTARGATSGSLGVGGRGSSNCNAWGGGGGGGGYYGGGGGSSSVDHGSGHSAGGSGGSGFIGGVEKGETFSGSSQYGHVGNGYSIITILSQQTIQLKSKLHISHHFCYL